MLKPRFIAPLALCLALLTTPVMAQEKPNCAPFDVIVQFHADKFQETRVAQGILGENLMVIFASENGETFSVVFVNHEGIGCLAGRGGDWQIRNDAAPVPEVGL